MSDISSLTEDLPPEIRDQEDLIIDGVIDEFEALEELEDDKAAKNGTAKLAHSDEESITLS